MNYTTECYIKTVSFQEGKGVCVSFEPVPEWAITVADEKYMVLSASEDLKNITGRAYLLKVKDQKTFPCSVVCEVPLTLAKVNKARVRVIWNVSSGKDAKPVDITKLELV